MFNTDIRSLDRIYLLRDYENVDVVRLFNDKTLDEVKEEIDKLANQNIHKCIKFKADEYGYDGGVSLSINIYELETEVEWARRQKILEVQRIDAELRKQKALDRKKKHDDDKEARERKLLEELKAKYEGK